MLVTSIRFHGSPLHGVTFPRFVTLAIVLAFLVATTSLGCAADTFAKLRASQIRSAFIGMDFTDEVHWAIQYMRDGTVKSFSMGIKDTGKWRFEGDVLCVDYVSGDKECNEIWRSGANHQLRRLDGSVFLECILVKYEPRS